MRHELTIRSSDRGISEIIVTVPPGQRAEGLRIVERALPAIRDIDRLVRRQATAADDIDVKPAA